VPIEFQLDFEKTLAVLGYLGSQDVPELTTYKICKLIFLADKYHLVRYGRPITGDRYCALPDGPIPSAVYNVLKDVSSGTPTSEESAKALEVLAVDKRFQYPRITANGYDAEELSESELTTLKYVIGTYGNMNFFQLKAITHQMVAYKKAWKKAAPEDKESWPMAYEDFFEQDPDAIAGAKEEMVEESQLRKVFPVR
jgi:uncharacterized phage-associated protein